MWALYFPFKVHSQAQNLQNKTLHSTCNLPEIRSEMKLRCFKPKLCCCKPKPTKNPRKFWKSAVALQDGQHLCWFITRFCREVSVTFSMNFSSPHFHFIHFYSSIMKSYDLFKSEQCCFNQLTEIKQTRNKLLQHISARWKRADSMRAEKSALGRCCDVESAGSGEKATKCCKSEIS